ncbi:thiamine pyrophosphate-binding protein [Janthinobacterium sp. 64]|uniref:thiamine pyrophosphate-binding protein n=1 Tax=Janthinobacterium sp. 64 TaxID=2035208 RepID=UPI000C2C53A9|nr:thiamine pyrophosphate-binding protein [Janthinobacterium sp. 64]PKB22454.1 acetolactate synthase-1/2/3 large subunit [Janthinobacterium sp. 64]
MKIRVADYIASRLLEQGVKHVFLLNGGMMMHLVDTLGREGGLGYIHHHHEQASAMAADGYARRSGELGVCYATSGPGATNILTGLAGAWQDSTPLLFLTGQSKSTQTIQGSGIAGLRQFGTFEVDIVPIVASVTKYAQIVMDPLTIRYHLEKALYLAQSGRPGPVLLDLPLDVQGALIEPDELPGYVPEPLALAPSNANVAEVLALLQGARRPLILAGYGVRCANAVSQLQQLAGQLGIPVATSQLGKDVMYFDHPLFVGHPGPKGDRAGNFAVQSADVILSIGCSLHGQTTGWESELFAPSAVKIQVELDAAVIARGQVGVSHAIQAGSLEFIDALLAASAGTTAPDWSAWRACTQSWKERYPVSAEAHVHNDAVNFYYFAEELSCMLADDACVVADAGSAFYVMGQALRVKNGQRFISSGSMGAMGFALPVANGAATTGAAGPTVCVTGDGSLMTNVHELSTMSHFGLNVKLFVINNDGYVSMRNTQRDFLGAHYVGADSRSGVFIPSMESMAASYALPFVRCDREEDLAATLLQVMAMDGPVLCEIVAPRDQKIIPAVVSVRLPDGRMRSSSIDSMFPHLPAEIQAREMEQAAAL